jgi:hypothetical protein
MRRLLPAIILAVVVGAAPTPSSAQVVISLFAPPILPVYVQPPVPAPNYIWMPGYWAWGTAGYYWVPGTWVLAPSPGLLWTPGYWSAVSNGFSWNQGYWGPGVGFYGGVPYGYGYYGTGYVGGQWAGNVFRYNTAVTNVNTTIIKNVYVDKTVVVKVVNRTSYNGGPHGWHVRPTPAQLAVAPVRRVNPTPVQHQHEVEAGQNRTSLATVNHGTPPHPAVVKPLTPHNRPPDFRPVTSADRQAVHVARPPARPPEPAKPPHRM